MSIWLNLENLPVENSTRIGYDLDFLLSLSFERIVPFGVGGGSTIEQCLLFPRLLSDKTTENVLDARQSAVYCSSSRPRAA